jgi:chromosomal replication initiation ATPase DnaA
MASQSLDQMRLPFAQTSYDRENLIVSDENKDLSEALESWDGHPDPYLVLIGGHGTGKSHFGTVWASEVGAARFEPHSVADLPLDALSEVCRGSVFLDDADRLRDQNALFHLLNLITQQGGRLLMTAQTAPSLWPVKLPDLVSRLAALRCLQLQQPSDETLSELLRRAASHRGLILDEPTRKVILTRMERSFDAVAAFIDAFDAELTRRPGVSPSTLARRAMAALYPER